MHSDPQSSSQSEIRFVCTHSVGQEAQQIQTPAAQALHCLHADDLQRGCTGQGCKRGKTATDSTYKTIAPLPWCSRPLALLRKLGQVESLPHVPADPRQLAELRICIGAQRMLTRTWSLNDSNARLSSPFRRQSAYLGCSSELDFRKRCFTQAKSASHGTRQPPSQSHPADRLPGFNTCGWSYHYTLRLDKA